MAYETADHETSYCFPDVNSSCVREQRSTEKYNLMYVFFSLLSAWTVFLNLLVIISISHFKKLHTPTNLLILSLAVADFFIGLFMPIEAMRLIEMCWYFGDFFCGLYLLFISLICSASLGNLVLIAIDRYVAVCHPLLYQQKITLTRTITVICLKWVCFAAYNSACVINNGYFDRSHKIDKCYGQCLIVTRLSWVITDLFTSFIIPCTVILTLYLRIFFVVHQQVKVINSLTKSNKRVPEGTMQRKSERKAALTLGIIVMVYLLCWIPFYICSLSSNSSKALNILVWAVYINSGLNPLVYALFYPWFRKTVKVILTLNLCPL